MSIVNTNRLKMKKIVNLFPGIHLRKLQRVMNTSFNTTRYHVHNLEKSGEIYCSVESGHTRLYPVGLDARTMGIQAAVLNRTTRKILAALLKSGPMGNGEISTATELAKSTVSEHIESLRKSKIVRRNVSVDGTVSYEVQGREDIEEVMAAFQESLGATDRFIELWDF